MPTWLAALVNPVLWPGTANEKSTRPMLRKAGILGLVSFMLSLSSLCKSRAFLNIIMTLRFLNLFAGVSEVQR